jgi:HK97 family phage prohead protease
MIRDNREYRNVSLQNFELRKEGENEQTFIVEGYATTWDEYVLFEDEGVQYKEQILPEAFKDADMSDVIFVKDHEGTVFARTKNGTLQLSVDDHGLKVRADMSKTSSARAAFEEIESGMYDQMSFAFTVNDDEYDKKSHKRTIRGLKKLYDTSFVGFPANPGTDIGVATRSYFDGVIEAERAERLELEARLTEARNKYREVRNNGN